MCWDLSRLGVKNDVWAYSHCTWLWLSGKVTTNKVLVCVKACKMFAFEVHAGIFDWSYKGGTIECAADTCWYVG